MTSQTFYDQEGRPVRLGPELGRGGEGAVFTVTHSPELAAKVYHQPIAPQKAEKLAAMAGQKSDGLLAVAAWPVGTLSAAPGDPAVGLLMPRVSGLKPVHLLYGPKSRLAEFPRANWTFLVHAACNLARALAVLHAGGNVVGDINHGNILVSGRATVKLIDCDSFQIQAGERRFLCEVGVPTHTPPELQGRNLRAVTRTPNHDAFGLAVVIFQLLFLGRHPFSGTYLGRGDMPLEQAIRELRFAYGREAAVRRMRQPPGTPGLLAASPPVAALFERAFSPGSSRDGVRPLPREWVTVLEGVRFRDCDLRKVHTFAATLESCPWCPIEVTTGTLLFKAPDAEADAVQQAFDIAAVWSRIQAVPPPGPPMALIPDTPQAEACEQAVRQGWKGALAFLGMALSGIVPLLVGGNPYIGWVLLSTMGLASLMTAAKTSAARRAQKKLAELLASWQQQPADAVFLEALRNLDHAVKSYLELPALQRRRLIELEDGLRRRQLEQYLDSRRVDESGLEGLTPGVLATLQSHGIETAADVLATNLLIVPSIDPGLMGQLRTWRRQMEKSFVFDAGRGIDADDLLAVGETIARARQILEQQLLAGPDQLQKITSGFVQERQALAAQIDKARARRDKALAELRNVRTKR